MLAGVIGHLKYFYYVSHIWFCSTGLTILAGCSLTQYLRWGEAQHSLRYLKRELSEKVRDFTEVDGWIPYSIPNIIDSMTGRDVRYLNSYPANIITAFNDAL